MFTQIVKILSIQTKSYLLIGWIRVRVAIGFDIIQDPVHHTGNECELIAYGYSTWRHTHEMIRNLSLCRGCNTEQQTGTSFGNHLDNP